MRAACLEPLSYSWKQQGYLSVEVKCRMFRLVTFNVQARTFRLLFWFCLVFFCSCFLELLLVGPSICFLDNFWTFFFVLKTRALFVIFAKKIGKRAPGYSGILFIISKCSEGRYVFVFLSHHP